MANAGHYVAAVRGLGMLRAWLSDPDDAREHFDEIARIAAHPSEPPLSMEFDVPPYDVEQGYAKWAATYDEPGNVLIDIEQPAMEGLIDELPAGRVLDAACGTGRYARLLADRGHRVTGVDQSREMLAKARARVPEAELVEGSVTELPLADASFDAVVCGLTLTHFESIAKPISEFARVLRPGGRVLLSDLHPMLTALGATAFFVGADGAPGYVSSHMHLTGAYLDAFAASGLSVARLIEPRLDEVNFAAGANSYLPRSAARSIAGLPGALVWSLVKPA